MLLPVLTCGCVNGAGGVGRLISTELGGNLSARGLVLGLAVAGGGVSPERGANSRCRPPEPVFAMILQWQWTSGWLHSLLVVVRQ